MGIIRPYHALGWLIGGIVCGVLTTRFFGSAFAPKSSAGLFGWTLVCFGMFIREITRKHSIKTSKEFPGIPLKPSVYTVFFKAMKKAGIRFSRNADALLMDRIFTDHLHETVTVNLILACFGDLYAKGKIRPKNFAAAPPGDEDALQKAVKKLSADPAKTIYATRSYDGTILVSVDRDHIENLNAALSETGVEFTLYK